VSADVKKMRTAKQLVEDFLQARKDFRDMRYNESFELLQKITEKVEKIEELQPLYREAKLLMDVVPILEE